MRVEVDDLMLRIGDDEGPLQLVSELSLVTLMSSISLVTRKAKVFEPGSSFSPFCAL